LIIYVRKEAAAPAYCTSYTYSQWDQEAVRRIKGADAYHLDTAIWWSTCEMVMKMMLIEVKTGVWTSQKRDDADWLCGTGGFGAAEWFFTIVPQNLVKKISEQYVALSESLHRDEATS